MLRRWTVVDDAGAPVDAGTEASADAAVTYPAPHPPLPQVLSAGGPVLAAPKVVAVTFPSDPAVAVIDEFLQKLAASPLWTRSVAEYGVGPLTVGAAVRVPETAPTSIDAAAIKSWIEGRLDGSHPELPAPDDDTIYALYFPASTTITTGAADVPALCPVGGYHDEGKRFDGTRFSYAVMARCPPTAKISTNDILTSTSTSTLTEMSADPFVRAARSYRSPDADHLIWAVIPIGGEIGDMCEFQPQVKPPVLGFAVRPAWSNRAARESHAPCAFQDGSVYFNSAPVLEDAVGLLVGGTRYPTKGVKIPEGQSRTIEVDLFSDAPTSKPWSVAAYDARAVLFKEAPTLTLSLDRKQGTNGDKLHLTITRLKPGSYGGAEFVLVSTLDDVSQYWFGFVGS